MRLKKTISLILAIVLMIICLPIVISADEQIQVGIASGTCGDNATWELASDGTLTISGTGKMYDYNNLSNRSPWNNYRYDIGTVIIEEGVTSIGNYAFNGCTSLTTIDLPNSITSIGISAFDYCKSLTSIDLPNNITSIDIYAFGACTSLTTINIPNSVTSIGNYAFTDCKSLTTINIPNSVTSIGGSVFENCTSLTTIDLPNSITSIEIGTFNGCTSLTTINIPNSITSIGFGAFLGCTSLTTIDLPNSITSIDSYAFTDCTSLESLNIPSTVEEIGCNIFQNCTSFKNVFIKNEIPFKIGTQVFDNCSDKLTIWLPKDSVEKYKQAECWQPYLHLLKEIDYNLTVEDYEDKQLSNEKQAEFDGDKVSIANHISNKANNLQGVQISQYLDIELYKTGYDFTDEQMHDNTLVEEDTEQWEVRIPIPQELLEDNYELYIIRVHNGVAETLNSEIQGNEIVFHTNKFSTYALAYKGKNVVVEPEPPQVEQTPPTIFINPYVQQIIDNKPQKINPTTGGYDYTSVYLISALMVLTAILIIKIKLILRRVK